MVTKNNPQPPEVNKCNAANAGAWTTRAAAEGVPESTPRPGERRAPLPAAVPPLAARRAHGCSPSSPSPTLSSTPVLAKRLAAPAEAAEPSGAQEGEHRECQPRGKRSRLRGSGQAVPCRLLLCMVPAHSQDSFSELCSVMYNRRRNTHFTKTSVYGWRGREGVEEIKPYTD